jgi:hypothetical protein
LALAKLRQPPPGGIPSLGTAKKNLTNKGETTMKSIFSSRVLFLLAALLIAVTAFSACTSNNTQNTVPPSSYQSVGSGATVFDFHVTGKDGNVKAFKVSTNETTVGAALLSAGLIAGETSSYGLMVTTVDGVTADYTADNAYWAFYVNGEYATAGVDSTNITQGVTYSFVWTKA